MNKINSPSKNIKSLQVSNTNASNSFHNSICKNTTTKDKTQSPIRQDSPSIHKKRIDMSTNYNNYKDIEGQKTNRYDYFGNLIKKKGKHKIIFADNVTDRFLIDVSLFDKDKIEKIQELKTVVTNSNSNTKAKESTINTTKTINNNSKDDLTCVCVIF